MLATGAVEHAVIASITAVAMAVVAAEVRPERSWECNWRFMGDSI
jgi:Flp pilus assembly pilin Flp